MMKEDTDCVELFRASYLELAFFFIHWNNHGLMT